MAAAPSAIDLAAVHGLGLPRAIGGPMQAADEAGALAWRTLLREQAAAEAARPGGRPGFWTPGPLWDDLVKNGSRFADLG
jgi:3-hydroxyacyl-CoA dehydrogenase